MDIYELVTIASKMMIAGAVFECIAILIGYAVFSAISLFEGGSKSC